ncbi:DinB family protein [Psychrobacillus psychrodurans]|uniref:DinB family protein n=1 Tax=Psychrobacillus psychrodurans TaxID=126157 RepID=UPI001F4EBF42|nr:DinB family protein [Psychrobacillus psychrodurans]MCK1999068.1 DinB family protein [Psychrobacillus psychrodurans]
MENHQLSKMYDYHVWANQLVIQHMKKLPEKVYNENVKSVFSSISEVLIHLYGVDIIWLETMKESSFQNTIEIVKRRKSKVAGASIDELEKFYAELSEEFYNFLANEQNLERIIITEHPKYGRCEFVLNDLLTHVVNHGTYHRGNITAMLHQQGEQGVPTDYVYYIFASQMS